MIEYRNYYGIYGIKNAKSNQNFIILYLDVRVADKFTTQIICYFFYKRITKQIKNQNIQIS